MLYQSPASSLGKKSRRSLCGDSGIYGEERSGEIESFDGEEKEQEKGKEKGKGKGKGKM